MTGKPGAESIAGMVEVRPLPSADVVIAGVGARAPCGLTALQVAMCARAGKLAPRESHMIDRHGEPIAMPRLASIGDHVTGLPRFVGLGGPSLTQAAHPYLAAAGQGASPLPVFVALPSSSRPGVDPKLASQIAASQKYKR